MLDSITIKNYKAIQSEEGLTLKDLKNVNYLVGKNGCGKSSVLEWIKKNYKTSKYQNSEYSIQGERWLLRNTFIITLVIVSLIPLISNLSFIFDSKLEFNEKLLLVSNKYFKLAKILAMGLLVLPILMEAILQIIWRIGEGVFARKILIKIVINETINKIDYRLWYNLQFIGPTFLENLNINVDNFQDKFTFYINGKWQKIDLKSDGEKKFITLIASISALTDSLKFTKTKIILIDEPEKYLHPDFQKKICIVLDSFAKSSNKQFIISTHSPFIISEAAKYPDTQKVYLLEDGQTRDLDGILGQGQEGYSGNQCKYVVNKMLGVDTSDFLPSKIVFCEQSLCVFLQIVNARFYNKDLQFKTPMDKAGNGQGGDHFVIEIAELEKIIEKGAKNLLPTDFTIIMDIPNESHLLRKLENVRAKHPDKILTLTTRSFEEKFDQDPKLVSRQLGGKIQNAKDKAIVITKEGFETKFAEILKIFNN